MVDKKFLILKEHRVITHYDLGKAWNDFYNDPANQDINEDIDKNYAELFEKYFNEQTSDWEAEDIADLTDEEYEEFDKEFREWLKSNNIKRYDLSTNKVAQKRFSKWLSNQIKQKDDNGNPKYFKSKTIEVVKYNQDKAPSENSRVARNNMIVDITRAIMANPKTSYMINSPGNYDNLGIEADRTSIMRDPELVQKWVNHKLSGNDNVTVEMIADSLLNATSKELSSFLKEFKKAPNPLDLETFAYYHNQNMTGGKLISIYANNTTMQAKYQQSNLGVSERYRVSINGHTTESLHSVYRDVTKNGKTVRTLISKNCAEFSAASVDNVKDPKLANLMQSTDNAFITGTMLRMGLTIEEIGLFFSMPFFSTELDEVAPRGSDIEDMYKSKELLEISSKELATIILDPNADDRKARAIFAKILTVAERVKRLTQISRADSPNGAISNTIAGALAQEMAVTNFQKQEARMNILTGMDGVIQNLGSRVGTTPTRDSIREALKRSDMPLLQAFYYLGIESALQSASQQFRQINPVMKSAIEELDKNSKYRVLPKKTINSYLTEAVVYGLSKSDLFRKDINKQRAYFINKFAQDFIKAKQNPEIAKYGFIKALTVDKFGNIVMENAPRLKGVRDMFSRDLCLMLLNDNHEVSSLAMNLFKYSYFKDGLGWRPNGFSPFFNTLFLSSIPSYINTLRAMTFDGNDGMNWNNFHQQFIRNHAKELFKDVTSPMEAMLGGTAPNEMVKSIDYVKNPKNYSEPYSNVIYLGALYEIDYKASTSENIKYNKISQIEGFNPTYDANNDNLEDFISDYVKAISSIGRTVTPQDSAAAPEDNGGIEDALGSMESDNNIDPRLYEMSDMEDMLAANEEHNSNDDYLEANAALEDFENTPNIEDSISQYDGNDETGNEPCKFDNE